jgi:hypothetical protein
MLAWKPEGIGRFGPASSSYSASPAIESSSVVAQPSMAHCSFSRQTHASWNSCLASASNSSALAATCIPETVSPMHMQNPMEICAIGSHKVRCRPWTWGFAHRLPQVATHRVVFLLQCCRLAAFVGRRILSRGQDCQRLLAAVQLRVPLTNPYWLAPWTGLAFPPGPRRHRLLSNGDFIDGVAHDPVQPGGAHLHRTTAFNLLPRKHELLGKREPVRTAGAFIEDSQSAGSHSFRHSVSHLCCVCSSANPGPRLQNAHLHLL